MYSALADPTRGAILSHLAPGQAAVNELAEPLSISQPAVSKRLKVLEHVGQIERVIDKQRRPARLVARPMKDAVAWLQEFQRFWAISFDQVDDLLEDMKTTSRTPR